MSFLGKRIVITGGTSGLGASIVSKLYNLGANIYVIGKDQEKIKKLSITYPTINYLCCDLTSPDQINKSFDIILNDGSVDILINNAGIWLEGQTEKKMLTSIKQVFDVNTQAPILCSQKVIPAMKQSKQGQILNVVSIAGIDASPNWSIYAASKAAISHFSKSLQEELQSYGIKVMTIYPGGMNTNIFENAGNDYGNASRMMDKDNVADIVLYMISQPEDVNISHLEVRKMIMD